MNASIRSLVPALLLAASLNAPAFAEEKTPDAATVSLSSASRDIIVKDIQSALSEQRYVDAGALLDQALASGTKDSRLIVLGGELQLAQGQTKEALASFRSVDTDQTVRAQALQGEGIALSTLGFSTEALGLLEEAVKRDPNAWQAWNVLGSEYDKRRDWAKAEDAYGHALAISPSSAIVLNNRGFSRFLQKRFDDAETDFVAALKFKPDLSPARTNLRLVLAMKGDYDRAVAGGGAEAEQAALLNNAGVAAMLRGDLPEAEKLFAQAIKIRSDYYARAQGNLNIVHNLMAQNRTEPVAGDAGTHQ